MSEKNALKLDQRKTFPENCKPLKIWLCLAYKITESNRRLQFFTEFIQTQKRYPTSHVIQAKSFLGN